MADCHVTLWVRAEHNRYSNNHVAWVMAELLKLSWHHSMWAERERQKKPLRAQTYFCNSRSPLRDLPLHTPLRSTRFSVRSAPTKFKISSTITVGKLIARFIVKCVTIKICSTNFDQCRVTKNHKDYSNRQQKRSPLSPQTVNSLYSLFNRWLNIKHLLIVSTWDSCELINKSRFLVDFKCQVLNLAYTLMIRLLIR